MSAIDSPSATPSLPATHSSPATDLEPASGTQLASAGAAASVAGPAPPKNRHWLLRAGDQRTIAALSLVSLIALAFAWLIAGGWSGGLIEIEHQASQPAEFRVDANTAPWPELAQLPGIGPTLAGRIVDSRDELGPFRTHDDLLRVSGIGPKKLARLKPYLLPLAPEAKPAPMRGAKAN